MLAEFLLMRHFIAGAPLSSYTCDYALRCNTMKRIASRMLLLAAVILAAQQMFAQQLLVAEPVSTVLPPNELIRPGDEIEISLSGVPQAEVRAFNRKYTVGGDRHINLPYIGFFRTPGLTPMDIEEALRASFNKTDRWPTITVKVTRPPITKVGGQIRPPVRGPFKPQN